MKAKDFVKKLNALIDSSVSPSLYKDIIEGMRIVPQKHSVACRDELACLIFNYEMDEVEIGQISFLKKYQPTDTHLVFGKIEIDLLAVSRESQEIVMLDHDETNYVMLKCSKDAPAFLELLFMYSVFIISKLLDKNGDQKPGNKDLYEIAGGDDYKQFVDFLFG